MRYEVIRRKGIVRAVRGDTSERSPYLTALSAVTVATEPRRDETKRVIHKLCDM